MDDKLILVTGAFISIMLTVIGYLVTRSISNVDTTVKELIADVQTIKADVQSNNQLREFQNMRISKLEDEKATLTEAFHEVDVLIRTRLNERVTLRKSKN